MSSDGTLSCIEAMSRYDLNLGGNLNIGRGKRQNIAANNIDSGTFRKNKGY